jgi:hypothetical protein
VPLNIWTRDFGFALIGSTATTGDTKLYGIDFDIYIPNEERE